MGHFAEHFQNGVGRFLPTEVGGALQPQTLHARPQLRVQQQVR